MLQLFIRVVVLFFHVEVHQRSGPSIRLHDAGEDLLSRPERHRFVNRRHRHVHLLLRQSEVGHQRTEHLLGEELILLRDEIGGREEILARRHERFAVPRRGQVVTHPHQEVGLASRFFRLREMHVHLVSVEICVVGSACANIETKGPPLQDFDVVTHDG